MADSGEHKTQLSAVIEAEIRTPKAVAQIFRTNWKSQVDTLRRASKDYWIDLCLTPRAKNIRASYPRHWTNGRFEQIGEVFVIPPGEDIYLRSDQQSKGFADNSQVSLVCQLNAELVSEWFDGDLKWTSDCLEMGLDITDQSIRGLLMRMTREALNPGFASEKIIELLGCQLAIELGRYLSSQVLIPGAKGGLATWRLRIIDERIRDISKIPTLSELAALCDLSVRQLSRGFRESRGHSLGHYIEQRRFEYAKQMLLEGSPIKNISHSMGYSSPSGFSNAFRRIMGAPPGQFSKLL